MKVPFREIQRSCMGCIIALISKRILRKKKRNTMIQSHGEAIREELGSGSPGKLVCLLAGIAAFCALHFAAPLPEGMSPDGLKVASVLALMMIWWLTEAVPLAITALVPLVIFPFTGVMD